MCIAQMVNSIFASRNARHLLSCMASTFLEAPEFTMATTAELSHWANITFSCQLCPHTAAANTIGASSFTVMCVPCILATHGSINQRSPQKATPPHEPDASEVITMTGFAPCRAMIIADPFHSLANDAHHSMSALASRFSRTNWSSRLVDVDSLFNLRR